MNIFYLHGFLSTGQSSKIEAMRESLPDCKIIGLEYDPHNPAMAIAAIHKEMQNTTWCQTYFVGTSLGGFWAMYAAAVYNVKASVINPSVCPSKSIKPGNYHKYHDGAPVEVTDEMIEALAAVEFRIEKQHKDNVQVFLAMDDDVIDATVSYEQLKNRYSTIYSYDDGGHRFQRFDEITDLIKQHYSG